MPITALNLPLNEPLTHCTSVLAGVELVQKIIKGQLRVLGLALPGPGSLA